MQIKKLRLTGFKSFVEPSELHIRPGLTGIVGPNGCGKSNLLEAFRWVMGESSSKSMRGGGMDDVIFAGTSTRPARNFAEVSLYSDLQGEIAPNVKLDLNGNELEVVRRIERGAGSAYRANGRDVRAKDIALIFADAATGAHSPALISQGKIAHIIAARPAERRAMLEEAAGIAGLHVRRKDAEQKLGATENNLTRLLNIVDEMEVRVASLRRQARSAERYRQISAQIRQAEGRLIFVRWRDAVAALEATRKESLATEVAVLTAQREIEALSIRHQQQAIIFANYRPQVDKFHSLFADVDAALIRAQSERRNLHARLEDLERQRILLQEDRDQESSYTICAREALVSLEAEAKDLTQRKSAYAKERATLAKADQRSHRHRNAAELALAQAQALLAQEAAEHHVRSSARDHALRAAQQAATLHVRLQQDRTTLGDSGALVETLHLTKAKAVASEEATINAEKSLDSTAQERQRAAAFHQQANALLEEKRIVLVALQCEIKALERALANSEINSDALLGEITVEAGYENALAAALGDDLNAGSTADQPRYWGAFHTPAPAALPPENTLSLANFVQGPDYLRARLHQIFVADQDGGQILSIGQRLVTKDGQMRRWDGFCTSGDGAIAGKNLLHRNRLLDLSAEVELAGTAFEAAELDSSAANQAMVSAQKSADEARENLNRADALRRQALRAEDQAQAAFHQHHQAAYLLDERLAEAALACKEADAHLAKQQAEVAELPNKSIREAQLRQADAAHESARALARESRAHLAEQDQASSARDQRLAVVQSEIRGWKSRAGEGAKRIDAIEQRDALIAQDLAMLAARPAKIEKQISDLIEQRAALEISLNGAVDGERCAAADLKTMEEALLKWREESATVREARAATAARLEAAEQKRAETNRASEERFACPPPLLPARAEFDPENVDDIASENSAYDRLVAERHKLGAVNLVAADELAELDAESQKISQEVDELQQAIHRLRGSIGNLNREGRARLLAAFEAVNGHFQRLFTSLFDGGLAHLELVDSDDPLEAGLEIMVQPPGKRLSTLTLLSGGEQALTAIALVFSLFLTNPAPLSVLDEVDAPLDDANIERFCDLLDMMVRETSTRFLIVTHNAVTMARMHRLYGVTMVERGVSRLVSVDLGRAEALLSAE